MGKITMMKTASIFIVLVLFSGTYLGAYAGQREGCAVCGMYLDLYERTKYIIHFNDGISKSTCSLACAAGLLDENKDRIEGIMTSDFLTGKLIAAQKAYYLEGSDIPGVMSYVSRLAFSSKKLAISFKKKHGGMIISFDEALKNQLKDKKQ